MKIRKLVLFITVFFLIQSSKIVAQYPNHTLPQYPDEWNAQWITHPDIDKTAYGLIHFRNKIQLDAKPEKFIIHVSGDNHYRLYINGKEVCYGPQAGDVRHWRYETLDVALSYKKGKIP